jgi:flagellar basal body rod protein FlgF
MKISSAGLVTLAMLASGCQHEQHVTRGVPPGAQLRVLGRDPIDFPDPQTISADRQREIDELVNQVLSAPRLDARVAAAIGASDAAAESLRQTIEALNTAEEIVLYNVRNADTAGFKSSRCLRDGNSYVVRLDLQQGRLDPTNRPLDVAIDGAGFFAVKVPNGIGYARSGNLSLNARYELVLGEDYVLDPPVRLPQGTSDIEIARDGTISAVVQGQPGKQVAGKLQLVRFINPESLNRLNEGILQESDTSGPPKTSQPGQDGAGVIVQGHLESSNVDLTRERLRLRFLTSWRAAIDQALRSNSR